MRIVQGVIAGRKKMSDAKYSALIVDDNWYNRDIFRIALENAGYQVTEVDNGREGLNLLETRSFNLMVLDLQMPGIDGITVLHQVHEKPAHKDMRVVVVTANAHMATDEVDNLADHVMYKPIDVVDFAQFTHRLLATFEGQPSQPASDSAPAAPAIPPDKPATEQAAIQKPDAGEATAEKPVQPDATTPSAS